MKKLLSLLNTVSGNQLVMTHVRIPQSTLVQILHKWLLLHAYKMHIVQALEPDDRSSRVAFAAEILRRIKGDNDYLKPVCFSTEVTIRTLEKICTSKYNVRI